MRKAGGIFIKLAALSLDEVASQLFIGFSTVMKPTKEVSIEEVKFVSPEDYLQTVEDNNW